jgi:hypothetical protein
MLAGEIFVNSNEGPVGVQPCEGHNTEDQRRPMSMLACCKNIFWTMAAELVTREDEPPARSYYASRILKVPITVLVFHVGKDRKSADHVHALVGEWKL